MYAPGAMVIFGSMFRDLAEKETRVITFSGHPKLGNDSYALIDVYCVDPDCDCRRVMVNVIRDRDKKHLATINWAFDPGDPDRGPFLDPLNPQSEFSDVLLGLFKEILQDRNYTERLERHYRIVKEAVADPGHEVHQVLKGVSRKGPESDRKARAQYVGTLSDAELAGVWKEVGLGVPKELVDETIRRGGKMIPYLGPLLVDQDLWERPPEDASGWAPVHALMLLEALGGENVVPYATEFLTRGLGDDWLVEEGDRLVFSLGKDAVEAIWEIAADPKADRWGRSAAIGGLVMLGLAHESLRADLISRFLTLADTVMAKPPSWVREEDSVVLDAVLDGLASLHHEPAKLLIDQAYADRRFELYASNKSDHLELYTVPFQELLEDLKSDPLDHFKPGELARLGEILDEVDGDDAESAEPFVGGEKVGRNDP
jgi:hypothetical protein